LAINFEQQIVAGIELVVRSRAAKFGAVFFDVKADLPNCANWPDRVSAGPLQHDPRPTEIARLSRRSGKEPEVEARWSGKNDSGWIHQDPLASDCGTSSEQGGCSLSAAC